MFVSINFVFGQNFPPELKIENNLLTTGANYNPELFDISQVHRVEFIIDEPNWFQIMDGSGQGPMSDPGELVMGSMIVNDDIILDSVMIGIKGQTSDFQNNSEKKSFKVEVDALIDQKLMGYDALNFNGGFLDPSGMREVLYYDISKEFTQSLRANFIDLYINGDYWGPYSNVQQIEGGYIKEWFLNNDGTRWRALKTTQGGPGSPGGPFGTGRSTLNYNGPDSSDYNTDYTLKSTEIADPWKALIDACDDLNNLPVDQLYDGLEDKLDIDKTLWFLAQEIIFTDEDSYVFKGGMDYYVYWDQVTNRIVPMEVDGNSVLLEDLKFWSPFFNEDDNDFPLLNRLLSNPEVRQRYLAHMRTILKDYFKVADVHDKIENFAQILEQRIQDDPKKIYSYNQFLADVENLKSIVQERHDFLLANNEINVEDISFVASTFASANGNNEPPNGGETVLVEVQIEDVHEVGVKTVNLYYSDGIQGSFEKIEMSNTGFDDIYEAVIPGFAASSFVRYYFEAIGDDGLNTASYYPKGAEFDVFIYQVLPGEEVESEIVINELMASNTEWIADEAGEFEDWIEIYNNSETGIDLSGYHLSDNALNVLKWSFPDGTILGPQEYKIIWADNDFDQGQFHANFKLSSGGEELVLSDDQGNIIDFVEFDELEPNLSYARVPNGTGEFVIKDPTFGFNNEDTSSSNDLEKALVTIYPNPVNDQLYLTNRNGQLTNAELFNSVGVKIMNKSFVDSTSMEMFDLSAGIYILKVNQHSFIIVKN